MSSWPLDGNRVPEITVQQLADLLKGEKRPFLLDVRQPWENKQASLPDSFLLPLNRLVSEVEDLRSRAADAPIVVYCHHGMRSQVAAAALLKAGFKNVVSLAGGIDAWSALIDPSIPRY